MKLEINPRGNGACPLCSANGDCKLQKLLAQSLVNVNGKGSDESEMEIVVYSCSYFQENA
jgi:hypothetical protein